MAMLIPIKTSIDEGTWEGMYCSFQRSKNLGALVNVMVMIDHSIALATSSVTFPPFKCDFSTKVAHGVYVRVTRFVY